MRRKDREIKDSGSIESIIERCDVCRIALSDGNTPYIVTMNFGYVSGPPAKLYFHCAREGRKTDMIRKNNYACFEMDTDHELLHGEQACDFTMHYSSVVGYGHIEIIEENDNKEKGLDAIMTHYSDRKEFAYDPHSLARTSVLCLTISEITAKSHTH